MFVPDDGLAQLGQFRACIDVTDQVTGSCPAAPAPGPATVTTCSG